MPEKRECGTCTECCKTHKVDELKKRAGKWCRYRVKDRGCKIYPTRPNSCAEFECQWLKGHGEELDRPDRTRIVIDFLVLESIGNTMVLYEGIDGAFNGQYGKDLVAHYVSLGSPVLRRSVSGREVLLVPKSLQVLLTKLQGLAEEKRKVYIVGVRL